MHILEQYICTELLSPSISSAALCNVLYNKTLINGSLTRLKAAAFIGVFYHPQVCTVDDKSIPSNCFNNYLHRLFVCSVSDTRTSGATSRANLHIHDTASTKTAGSLVLAATFERCTDTTGHWHSHS